MAFTSNQLIIAGESTSVQASVNSNELNPQELEYILNLLKNTDLKGFQIELFYGLAIKLQNQYLKKTTK
jgi:hypothetical protein